MEKRTLGKTGMQVTALGFGGAEIGYERADFATVEKLLDAALDAGLNIIDTAECYPDSEEMIGRATAKRRESLFLFTKCGHAMGLEGSDWDPRMLERSIGRSLIRLRTDCVDLIQLHSCSAAVLRKGEVIEVLRRAKESGKARFIGYSGDHDDAAFAIETGAFDTLQTSISIADQEAIEKLLPKASERGMGVIAKRPIANAAWKTGAQPASPYNHPYWDRLQKLAYSFLQDGMEQSVSTALRFTLAQEGVHTAIVGTKNPERWEANAQLIAAGPLNEKEVAAIRGRWKEVAQPDWVGQV